MSNQLLIRQCVGLARISNHIAVLYTRLGVAERADKPKWLRDQYMAEARLLKADQVHLQG